MQLEDKSEPTTRGEHQAHCVGGHGISESSRKQEEQKVRWQRWRCPEQWTAVKVAETVDRSVSILGKLMAGSEV